jgi:hypothetical protein
MALVLLAALIVAALIHAARSQNQTPGRRAELVLVYVVVGYCGVYQIYTGFDLLLEPDKILTHLGLPTGNAVTYWTASIYLGGAFMAALAIWYRGSYLLAPVVTWAIYFAGANFAHLHALQLNSVTLTPVIIGFVFATHGLISVILVAMWGSYVRSTRLRLRRSTDRRGD